ncbi:MAG: hypothetical protein WCD53_30610 [Microcoleus sp.]
MSVFFMGQKQENFQKAWVLSADDQTDWKHTDWAETFASLSPAWMAEHFRNCADTIESRRAIICCGWSLSVLASVRNHTFGGCGTSHVSGSRSRN